MTMACKRFIICLDEGALVSYLLGFEEVGDIIGRRLPDKVLGRVYLLEATLSHDGDAVGEGYSIGKIMRNVDGRETVLPVKCDDFTTHLETVRGDQCCSGVRPSAGFEAKWPWLG